MTPHCAPVSLTKSLVWVGVGVFSLFCSIQSKQKFIHVFTGKVNAMHRLKITTVKYNQKITRCRSGFHSVHKSGFRKNLEMTQVPRGCAQVLCDLSTDLRDLTSLIDMEGHLHTVKHT